MGSLKIPTMMNASLALFSCLLPFSLAQYGIKEEPGFCAAAWDDRYEMCRLIEDVCNNGIPEITGGFSQKKTYQCCCECCNGKPTCGKQRCTAIEDYKKGKAIPSQG